VGVGHTTRCCSAIALALSCSCALVAQSHPPTTLSFFPARTIWTLALNNALIAPPAFGTGGAYFPIEGGRLAAYDLVSGTQRWVVSAAMQSEPASGDGLIFVAESGGLVALRETDGSVRWRLPFAESLAVPLVWDNQRLIAADTTGGIHLIRAADGHLIWEQNVGAQVHARPALAADRIYLPTLDGRIVALRIDTGTVVWEHLLGGAPNDILVPDDRLYVGSNDHFLYCLHTETGAIAWRWRTGADVIGLPVADDQRVYFVSLDNVLRGLSRRSGSQLWKRVLPFRPIAGPIHAADALIVSGLAPTLLAFNAKDGSPAGDISTAGGLASIPRIVKTPEMPNPLLVIVTNDMVKGATVTVMTRSIDPINAPFAPLPNPLVVTAGPTSASR
jgi:outer membrane protein assembly factor BamB